MEAIWSALLVFALLTTATEAGAEECPTNADQIATDRPDTTNSSLVVPYGTVRHGSNALAGTNTRLRLGVAHCTEFLIDVPTYFWSMKNPVASGGVSENSEESLFQRRHPRMFNRGSSSGLAWIPA